MSTKDSHTETGQVAFDNAFYDELSRYAVGAAIPVLFGDVPSSSPLSWLRNGTATLVRMQGRSLAITCHHVLAEFRRARAAGRQHFQLGYATFDPDERLIDENADADISVIDVSDLVDSDVFLSKSRFVEPVEWPPQPVSETDIVAFAGFPGVWREEVEKGHLRFYSFCSGASEVLSARRGQIVATIQIEECITDITHGKVVGAIDGMSGGPVFAWRKSSILRAELVGVIYEYSEAFDLLMARSVGVLEPSGRLIRQWSHF